MHVVWGFAKDFGLSGLKAGVLRSPAPARAAARALAYFATVSTDTQALLCDLLADASGSTAPARREPAPAAPVVRARRGATGRARHRALPASAGFSLWVDLRDRLTEPTFAAEDRLWRHVLPRAGQRAAGRRVRRPEPGWFRLCHAVDPELVATGIDRLAQVTAPPGST